MVYSSLKLKTFNLLVAEMLWQRLPLKMNRLHFLQG
nr:MAG TPA: hypothetical protein [Caudoviricetes sp.]